MHPALKIVKESILAQQLEFGSGSGELLLLIRELLAGSRELIDIGISINSLTQGLINILNLILANLEENSVKSLEFTKSHIATNISSFLTDGDELNHVTNLIFDCIEYCKRNSIPVSSSSIRVVKQDGGSVLDSTIHKGIIINAKPLTQVQSLKDANIIILGGSIDKADMETASTVVLNSSNDILNYPTTEEQYYSDLVEKYSSMGINAILFGGSLKPMTKHYLSQNNILALQTHSKFEMQRISKALNIPIIQHRNRPEKEEFIQVKSISVEEISNTLFTSIIPLENNIQTIVIRGSSGLLQDEFERAISTGIQAYKLFMAKPLYTYGACAIELQLVDFLKNYSASLTSVEKYIVTSYADAIFKVCEIMANNSNINKYVLIENMTKANKSDKMSNLGLDLSFSDQILRDISKEYILDNKSLSPALCFSVYDNLLVKQSIFTLATHTTVNLLKINQIIMSKPSGGPKFPNQGHWDEADDRQGFM